MGKSQPIPPYTKDSTQKTNRYKIAISQRNAGKIGFNKESKLKIETQKGELKMKIKTKKM